MVCQYRQILESVSQGWNCNGVSCESMIQVGTEATGGDFCLEVSIGGRYYAYIDSVAAIRSDSLDFPLLQCAQELRLKLYGKFSDFIKEDRASICQFEFSGSVVCRTRKGASEVSEELTFRQ